MIIHPEVIVTPDHPTVKFRQENVDLEKELPKILHAQGWDVGTYFHVQFISHDRSKLLYSAKFVVTEVNESQQTNDANPYAPMTKTIFNRKAEQIQKSWSAEKIDQMTIKWNPGKKVHQVMKNEEVLFESDDKEEAEKWIEAA